LRILRDRGKLLLKIDLDLRATRSGVDRYLALIDSLNERSEYVVPDRYVFDDLLMRVGISRSPLAAGGATPGIAWKAFRKALRLGFLSPFRRLAAITGHGAAIEAVFRKR
jgi:hypothetical protein